MNSRPALRYLVGGDRPAGAAARAAADLKRDGIAILPAVELMGSRSSLEELESAVWDLERARASELERSRAEIDMPGPKIQKPFVFALLNGEEGLDRRDVFARFALADPVRQVVNHYFGMYVYLTHVNVWHTLVTARPPSQSQLWHRDPEDRHILKLFLYLADVDEGAGPFTYAAGSHRRPYEVAPYSRKDGETPRSTDEELARLIPRHRWITATVPKGTMVFADTRGYHKGGLARKSERLAYVAEYLAGSLRGISTA